MKKKLIPVIAAIVLILAVIAVSVGVKLVERYSYSKERADLDEYFALSREDEIAIILQNERLEEKAKLIDGVCYFDMATIHRYFNDRFYEDKNEQLLLYTMPDETVRVEIGASSYMTKEGSTDAGFVIARYDTAGDGTQTLYVAADYVKKFTNFTYETFQEPNRVQVYTEFGTDRQTAEIAKDTAVRYQGGVKSPVLTDALKGDKVIVLEEMETWSKVKTADAFIGYVENKKLTNYASDSLISPLEMMDEAAACYVNPEFIGLTRSHKINLGWHAIAGTAGNDTLSAALENTKGLNVISPTWFALTDNEGNFSSYASSAYVKEAHERGIEVWALIDNFTHKESVDTYEVLSYTGKRSYLVENLVKTTLEYGIDGINVDFENISQDAGEHFIQFIRELSVACRQNGIVLSVDNYVPTGYTDHYDRKEQGIFADYVIIMGYDEHYSGSPEAGSVASIGFVQEGIEKTVAQVAPKKVINAVPFYTRIWTTEGAELSSEAVGMELAEQFVWNHQIELRWDEETCQNYGETQEGDKFYQVWLEDEDSIQAKLSVMQKHNLGGVAAWKLGFEKPVIWDVIESYLNQ